MSADVPNIRVILNVERVRKVLWPRIVRWARRYVEPMVLELEAHIEEEGVWEKGYSFFDEYEYQEYDREKFFQGIREGDFGGLLRNAGLGVVPQETKASIILGIVIYDWSKYREYLDVAWDILYPGKAAKDSHHISFVLGNGSAGEQWEMVFGKR